MLKFNNNPMEQFRIGGRMFPDPCGDGDLSIQLFRLLNQNEAIPGDSVMVGMGGEKLVCRIDSCSGGLFIVEITTDPKRKDFHGWKKGDTMYLELPFLIGWIPAETVHPFYQCSGCGFKISQWATPDGTDETSCQLCAKDLVLRDERKAGIPASVRVIQLMPDDN